MSREALGVWGADDCEDKRTATGGLPTPNQAHTAGASREPTYTCRDCGEKFWMDPDLHECKSTPTASASPKVDYHAALMKLWCEADRLNITLGVHPEFDQAMDDAQDVLGGRPPFKGDEAHRGSASPSYLKRVAEGVAAWMLHRFGPGTPEGDEAQTLLAAAQREAHQGGAVPEGWQLVPVEPTGQMLHSSLATFAGVLGTPMTRAAEAYKAMLRVAPHAPHQSCLASKEPKV